MRSYLMGGIILATLVALWVRWIDRRDEHLSQMYDCAHAHAKAHPYTSLEQGWIACEKTNR